MGTVDMARQQPNVLRMQLLGAEVRPVEAGSRTLKDAINEAIRDWVDQRARHLLPARLGPGAASLPDHGARLPGGDRARGARANPGRRPGGCRMRASPAWAAAPMPSACSTPSATMSGVALVGVEAGGRGHCRPGGTRRALAIPSWAARACCTARTPTCCRTRRADRRHPFDLRRAGLRRGGAGARLPARHRAGASTPTADDAQALEAFQLLARLEGILPALEVVARGGRGCAAGPAAGPG